MKISYSELAFYSYKQFCDRCEWLRDKYLNLSYEDKYIYKMFVYSISDISLYLKDTIWEYLNEDEDSMYYVSKEELLSRRRVKG